MITLKPITHTGKPHPRTKFTPEEDEKIRKLVARYGENDWAKIAAKIKGRNVRQCRERWRNYLSPDLDKSKWKEEEDNLLIEKYKELGPRWKTISTLFPNRTDIAVKNRLHKIVRGIEKKQKKINKEKRIKGKVEEPKEEEESVPEPTTPEVVEENCKNDQNGFQQVDISLEQNDDLFSSFDPLELVDDEFSSNIDSFSRFDELSYIL